MNLNHNDNNDHNEPTTHGDVNDDLNNDDDRRNTTIPPPPPRGFAAAFGCWSMWSHATAADGPLPRFLSRPRSLSTDDETPPTVHARGVYKYCSDLRSFSYLVGCVISFFLISMTTFMMIVSLSDASVATDDAVTSDRFDSYLSSFGYMGLYGYLITVCERWVTCCVSQLVT